MRKAGFAPQQTLHSWDFSFLPTYSKGDRGKYQLVVPRKGWQSFKAKLKILTRKTNPMSFGERIKRLNEVIQGWVNHYRMANVYQKLRKVKGWLRKIGSSDDFLTVKSSFRYSTIQSILLMKMPTHKS